jgi:Zn-dependent protease with chaperone function
MTSEDNLCSKIFQDLVDKKYIVTSQVLEESNECNYFQAKHPNIIQYHPDMKNINEDSIRFCLLHEENHNRHPHETVTIFLLVSAIFTIFWFIFHLFISLLFPIIVVSGIALKRREEYTCDEFAASTFKNELKTNEQPSEILRKTLEIMPYRWLSAIIHPSLTNRVKNVFNQYDEKS